MGPELSAPPKSDRERYRLYVRWAVLNYLYGAAKAGRPYVPGREVRVFMAQFIESRSVRENLLRDMRDTNEVGVLNQAGSTNKRYFLKAKTGERALLGYRRKLGEEQHD